MKALQTALEQIEFGDPTAEVGDKDAVAALSTAKNATAVASLLEEQQKKQVNSPQQRADALLFLTEHYLLSKANDATTPNLKTTERYLVIVQVDVETLSRQFDLAVPASPPTGA